MLWHDSEEVGNHGSVCDEDVQTMMVEKVTLSGKGRWNLMCFVY